MKITYSMVSSLAQKRMLERACRMAALFARSGWSWEQTLAELPNWTGCELREGAELILVRSAYDMALGRYVYKIAVGRRWIKHCAVRHVAERVAAC